MRRIFGFVLGGLVGAAIGAGVALLFAPESGEDLRSDIRSRGDEIVGQVKDAAADRRHQLQDRLSTLRQGVMPGQTATKLPTATD
jgi:gas vesicle protein